MSSHKRASIDIASIEMRNVPSPAPTYTSTFRSQDASPQQTYFPMPPKGGASNNPYFQSTSDNLHMKNHAKDNVHTKTDGDEPVRPDYHDPNHPHYARPTVQEYSSRRPSRNRIPQKRVLIPWLLAAVFFIITVWYTSILAGARFFAILHPLSSSPAVHEINVIINGDVLHGSVSVTTTERIIPMIPTSVASTPTRSSDSPSPTTTGRINGAPIPDTPPMSLLLGQVTLSTPTGFVTVTRRSY